MRPTSAAGDATSMPAFKGGAITAEKRPSSDSAKPTSFFLASEADIFGTSKAKINQGRSGSDLDSKPIAESPDIDLGSDRRGTTPAGCSYGVQTLQDALSEAISGSEGIEQDLDLTGMAGPLKRKRSGRSANGQGNTGEASASVQASPHRTTDLLAIRSSRANTISQPLTPLQLGSPAPGSALPSTPKSGSFRSLRLSDEEYDASDPDNSAGEEEARDTHDGADQDLGLVAPQLVMPSLSMPSRRPFTERGKQMGRLKVAVAGAPGVGKTSLIRAIVRECVDIVHLDPITKHSSSTTTAMKGKRSYQIVEGQASTKAYPAWWSDLEDSRVLRRRKSLGETVLERNLTFVDSDGPVDGLARYMTSLMQMNDNLAEMSESDTLTVLSGGGGLQIDVVLYVCETGTRQTDGHKLSRRDLEAMTTLSSLTSVVPVIARADTMTEAEIAAIKASISSDLPRCGVSASLLTRASPDTICQEIQETSLPLEDPLSPTHTTAPYAVSCLPGSDDAEMDASLLMSPSYAPPLVLSDLQSLVSQLFDPDTMTKLRHISAKKFLRWRSAQNASSKALSPFSQRPGPLAMLARTPGSRFQATPCRTPSSALDLSSAAGIGSGLPEFTRSRIRDHIQQEERLAHVQLAKWARDLQSALKRERMEYGALVEGERAKWLLKRLGEETESGRLLAASTAGKPSWLARASSADVTAVSGRGELQLPSWAKRGRYQRRAGVERWDRTDPLGISSVGDAVVSVGSAVLKVLGGGVVVGAVWFAICRVWDVEERWFRVGTL